MKKVLIAVDYHPNAEKVVKAGYALAKILNAQVCLLHVVSDIGYYNTQYPTFMGYDYYDLGMNETVHAELIKVSENYLAQVAKHLKDPDVQTHTVEGESADSILGYAKKWHASLIVMGTHSRSALEKLLMGNVASKVLGHTHIPVYMVPIKKN